MKHLLSTAKTELLGDRKPSVSTDILWRGHPHPTLPHQGGGLPLVAHIELPKEILIAIERHHTSRRNATKVEPALAEFATRPLKRPSPSSGAPF
jgi:hypothetical protein